MNSLSVLGSVSEIGYVVEARDSEFTRPRLICRLLEEVRTTKMRINRLRPTKSSDATVNSLSARHGVGAFPKHTDFVTQPIPPRYIALHCPVHRNAGTSLFETTDAVSAIATGGNAALYRVSGGRLPFSARFRSVTRWGVVYRYNSDCMEPLNDEARMVDHCVRSFCDPCLVIDWSRTSTIVFDNWRYLHARSSSYDDKNGGWLWRVAVWGAK